nr:MAG TPA: hypothetical protein [Microviridae sp.]
MLVRNITRLISRLKFRCKIFENIRTNNTRILNLIDIDTIITGKKPILQISSKATMRTGNILHNLGPSRNITQGRIHCLTIRSNRKNINTLIITSKRPQSTKRINLLNHKRLHSDIIQGRSINIAESLLTIERVHTTRIDHIGNKRSHNHEITILTKMIRTLTKSLTTRSLTSESTERTRRVTSTGSLIDHIRTEILTVGTKIQRGSGMLKVRNIELRINIVRIARSTCQSEIKPALNMALSGDITERNRLTVSIKINLDLRILITRSSQPRLKIVGRQTTLKNRSTRTEPRPRTERRITNGILSSPLTNSSRRIRSTLNVIQKSTQRRNRILNVTLFLRTGIKRRSKRSSGESLNLLIHIIVIENIEDTQHLQSRKLIAIVRISNNTVGRYQTNRKTTIIGQRTGLNNTTRQKRSITLSTLFCIQQKTNSTR